jgi:hypothetical protein
MKRRLLFGTVLALSVIIAVAAVAPAIANHKGDGPYCDDGTITFYSNAGSVILQLPPAPNITGTATPTHPTDLYVVAAHWEKHSAFGAAGHDLLYVALWGPPGNAYTPVAYITDYNDADFLNFIKTAWNSTFAWFERTAIPPPFFRNVITVEPDQLEVSRHGDIVTANLTCEVNVYLPFYIFPSSGIWKVMGNQTFTLPPMSLEFRGIDTPYKDEAGGPMPSGYTLMETGWRKPAWVNAEIPKWLNIPLRAVGSTMHNWKAVYTPP